MKKQTFWIGFPVPIRRAECLIGTAVALGTGKHTHKVAKASLTLNNHPTPFPAFKYVIRSLASVSVVVLGLKLLWAMIDRKTCHGCLRHRVQWMRTIPTDPKSRNRPSWGDPSSTQPEVGTEPPKYACRLTWRGSQARSPKKHKQSYHPHAQKQKTT